MKEYTLYLLTDYVDWGYPLTKPRKVVMSLQEAYNEILKNDGAIMVFGILPDGTIEPILYTRNDCNSFQGYNKVFLKEHIEDLKNKLIK